MMELVDCGCESHCLQPLVVKCEDEKNEYCMRWRCAKSRQAKKRVNELESMLEEQNKQIERQNEEIRVLKGRIPEEALRNEEDDDGGDLEDVD